MNFLLCYKKFLYFPLHMHLGAIVRMYQPKEAAFAGN